MVKIRKAWRNLLVPLRSLVVGSLTIVAENVIRKYLKIYSIFSELGSITGHHLWITSFWIMLSTSKWHHHRNKSLYFLIRLEDVGRNLWSIYTLFLLGGQKQLCPSWWFPNTEVTVGQRTEYQTHSEWGKGSLCAQLLDLLSNREKGIFGK